MGLLYVKTAEGKKKPSVWVYLFVLVCFLGGSYFVVTNQRETGLDSMAGKTKAQKRITDPTPIIKTETSKNGEMDAETVNAVDKQIAQEKEENGGIISQERQMEIQTKYRDIYNQKQAANFKPTIGQRAADLDKKQETQKIIQQKTKQQQIKSDEYLTFAERMQADGIKGKAASSGGTDFTQPKSLPGLANNTKSNNNFIDNTRNNPAQNWSKAANLLPLGTFIPCILDGDVITTSLSAYVWANVVLDVTFRRQLQLPKGLVRLRGKTATQPVQASVDIFFDTMVFSDGTELPITGYAYSAFDPRYPNKYKTRGIDGELIVPPAYLQIESLLLTAGLGSSQAYIQNSVNQSTTTPSSFTTIPVINPTTGQVQNTIQQSQGQPVNNNIGATLGLSAGQAALQKLVGTLQKDIEKYQPYVIVEKGTPLYVQLDATIDVSSRRINGTYLSKQEELIKNAQLKQMGIQQSTETFAPGDARSKYAGTDTSSSKGSGVAGVNDTVNSLMQQIQNPGQNSPQNMNQNQGTPSSGAKLEQILQGLGKQNQPTQ